MLIGFISEVQSLADRPVVISLDGGERLSEQELGLLADLCEALPSGMGIRVGFSTPDAESQSKVDTLVLAGARELPLKPLGPDLVREWMESRGLDPTRANEVIRLTDGYPLYVQDVISLMERGEDISGIEPDNKLAILTKRSLDTLAPGIEVIARKLCGFTDPPDQKGLLDLLGLSLPEWGVIERRLSEARIFSTKVNGRAWFHELRRRYIWDSVLTAAERSEVAYATVGELLREFETERRFILLTDIASLARQSQQLMDDPEVSWTLGIDLAALAIAAALIELTESAAALPLLTTNAVLNYARSVFNASDDLLSGLHDLEDLGFMSYASQTGSLVRLPQWAAPLVPAIIAGRSATELSRVPVSGAATMIFQDALAPRLGTFATAIYGMGRPEILQLVASVRPRRSGSGADSAVYLGTHQPSIA